MRKGKTGDWKNYFTPEQAAKLGTVYDKKMKGTGIDLELKISNTNIVLTDEIQ